VQRPGGAPGGLQDVQADLTSLQQQCITYVITYVSDM
jgi:hypothetical protein